jgi:hypothetical protein
MAIGSRLTDLSPGDAMSAIWHEVRRKRGRSIIPSFAAEQKPTVANPSYAAYTWSGVGVEIPIRSLILDLILGMPLF